MTAVSETHVKNIVSQWPNLSHLGESMAVKFETFTFVATTSAAESSRAAVAARATARTRAALTEAAAASATIAVAAATAGSSSSSSASSASSSSSSSAAAAGWVSSPLSGREPPVRPHPLGRRRRGLSSWSLCRTAAAVDCRSRRRIRDDVR